MGQNYEHTPRADGVKPAPDGDALYDKVVANSLDSKSYDKILKTLNVLSFPAKLEIGRPGIKAFGDICPFGSLNMFWILHSSMKSH
jgi:hypothetical protein